MGTIQDDTTLSVLDSYDCPIYDSDQYNPKLIDIESAETIIINAVKYGLDKEILLINDEKDDDLKLDEIPLDQYYSTWTDAVNNSNRFIFYYLTDIRSNGVGPATRIDLSMVIAAFDASNINSHSNIWRRKALRYGRVIQQCVQKRFKDDGRLAMTISAMIPQMFQINDNSPLYKVGGVEVSASFA